MQQNSIYLDCYFSLILKQLCTHSSGHLLTVRLNLIEFKVLDASVAKSDVAQNCKFKFVNLFRHYVSLFNF